FDESQDEDGFFDADSGNESESVPGPGQPAPPGILRRAPSPNRASGKGYKDGGDARHHLRQALAAVTDPVVKKDLEMQIAKLNLAADTEPELGVVEALRRADGAKRNAEHIHEQAVAAVLRIRSNLAAAEGKEATTAINLAKAVDARKVAALAVTEAEGLGGTPLAAEASEKKILNAEWDETFFGSIDGLDATPEEKAALLTLKQQEHRRIIEERAAKKRKAENGKKQQDEQSSAEVPKAHPAAGGAGAESPTGPAAASAAGQATSTPEGPTANVNEQQRIAEEAKKLSGAKFAAAAMATKAK
ncbi:unnamed protein product, partial [Prorocentrum cordatum]